MPEYFEAPDGHGESTVWTRDPDDPGHAPMPVIRESDVTTSYWPDVVARMTGTTEAALQSVIDRLSKESDSWHAIAMDLQAETERLRMTGTTITNDDATVQKIAQVINDEGGTPGNSIHSWRCEYPERYSPCDCVETTAKLILAALTGGPHD